MSIRGGLKANQDSISIQLDLFPHSLAQSFINFSKEPHQNSLDLTTVSLFSRDSEQDYSKMFANLL